MNTPLRQRLNWCAHFRRLVCEHTDALCDAMHREIGKPRAEAFAADILPLVAACKWHEKNAKRILKPRALRGGLLLVNMGLKAKEHRAPLGCVAIIATWNYPVQLLGVQIIQAVIAGNSVLVKPSEKAPASQSLLLDLVEKAIANAGLPPNTIERTPATREAGQQLCETGTFDKLVFTGSTAVGRAIAQSLAPRLIPSSLELSGCDSAIVLADADVSLAARVIHEAIRMNAGQTCMAPRRIIVEQAVAEELGANLLSAMQEAAARGPLQRMIDEPAANRVRDVCQDALAHEGAELLGADAGSQANALGSGVNIPSPIFIKNPPANSGLALGNHFGPACALFVVDSAQEAFALHSSFNQHLAVSLFTKAAPTPELSASLGASIVAFNDAVRPAAHPAGALAGRGPSGWGITQGEAGLLAMTRPVMHSKTGSRFRIPIEPPTEAQAATLKKVMRWLIGK